MNYQHILDQYAKAVYDKDIESFISLYDSKVAVFDTWNEWRYDRAGYRTMAQGWFASLGEEKVRVEFREIKVVQTAEQTVWIGELIFYGLSAQDDVLRSIANRWTWVMKNDHGIYKIVHEHSSLPIHTETFTGIMKKQ